MAKLIEPDNLTSEQKEFYDNYLHAMSQALICNISCDNTDNVIKIKWWKDILNGSTSLFVVGENGIRLDEKCDTCKGYHYCYVVHALPFEWIHMPNDWKDLEISADEGSKTLNYYHPTKSIPENAPEGLFNHG